MSANPLLKPVAGLRQLVGGDPGLRRIWRLIPTAGRCKQCFVPFRGPFSALLWLIQVRPSRKNPNLCTI